MRQAVSDIFMLKEKKIRYLRNIIYFCFVLLLQI
jgi:hypothetical protein